MGAPLGNQNAKKAKIWEGAIRRVLAENDGEKLRALAEKIVARALEGDVPALREVGDRIDGKVAQEISGVDGADLVVRLIPQDANL